MVTMLPSSAKVASSSGMDAGSGHQNIQIAPGFDCRYRPAAQGINQPFALRLCGEVGIMAIKITWGCLRVAFLLVHRAFPGKAALIFRKK